VSYLCASQVIYLSFTHYYLINYIKLNKPKQIFSEQAQFLRGLEFYSRPGHVRILVDSVALGQFFLEVYDMIRYDTVRYDMIRYDTT